MNSLLVSAPQSRFRSFPFLCFSLSDCENCDMIRREVFRLLTFFGLSDNQSDAVFGCFVRLKVSYKMLLHIQFSTD